MGRALDLVGQRFGRLLVLERVGASIPGVELPEIFYRKTYILIDYLSNRIYNNIVIKKWLRVEKATGRRR